jgi:phage shock protein PspC (stress-responsive transcriptional regulator)
VNVTNKENDMDMGTQQVRRLIRRTDNKMIAGVAAGLGDYFKVDPVWFRLGFVLTAFMGGFGLLIYAVLWVVMPEAGSAASNPAERGLERVANSIRGTPAWIGVAMVILGVILALNAAVDWRPGVIWGVALIVLGALFFVQKDAPPAAVGGPDGTRPVPPPPPPGASATDTAVLEPPPGGPPLPPSFPTGAAPPPPPRMRERSTLGFMTFGALLLTIGVLSLLDSQGVVDIVARQYVAISLGVIGLGLLVGSIYGRARWLIAPGLLLIPVVLAASFIHVPFEGGFGQRNFRPIGIAPAVTEYHLIAGEMILDLRALTIEGDVRIEATSVVGHIVVYVPDRTSFSLEVKAGAGEIDVFGTKYDGTSLDVREDYFFGTAPSGGTPGFESSGSVDIEIEVGMGQVEVRR